jgi:hypothetical protein
MESTAIDATPAGCLFSDWIARRGVSKSTAYGWRAVLGIETERRRAGTKVEVWLSGEQEQLLNAYGDALARGLSAAAALEAVGRPILPLESDGMAGLVPVESSGIVPVERATLVPVDATEPEPEPEPAAPVESDGVQRTLTLRRRLAALRDAVELGAPLSTAEVSLLLGARPGGDVVVRGRLRAVRERRNVWTIEPD